jgi:hypothetical protein
MKQSRLDRACDTLGVPPPSDPPAAPISQIAEGFVMRSNLFLVIAAVATGAAGCASSARQIDKAEKLDTGTASGPETRRLTVDSSELTLSRGELAVLRQPATVTPASDPTGVAGQMGSPSRWDAYLAGDTTALTVSERRGLILFTRAGCASCHDGIMLGGEKYRRLGEAIPVRTAGDSGRFSTTRDEADLFVYKVAPLRNIQVRSPYLHDGSVKKLGQAVRFMSRHQLAVDLTEDQVRDIRDYLNSLTGQLPPVKP